MPILQARIVNISSHLGHLSLIPGEDIRYRTESFSQIVFMYPDPVIYRCTDPNPDPGLVIRLV
jgi:hypothetical protein